MSNSGSDTLASARPLRSSVSERIPDFSNVALLVGLITNP
jgi:hypothetical protein